MSSVKKRKKTENENEKYDILQLDERIKKILCDESKRLSEYENRIESINEELKTNILYRKKKELIKEKEELEKKIEDINNNTLFAEYICVSQNIINEYINLLSVPTNKQFFGETKNDSEEKYRITNQDKLQEKFLEIAKKYLPIKNTKQEIIKKQVCTCGSNDFTHNDNNYICNECGLENIIYSSQTNFRDVDRVNLSQKYKYNRRIHFRDIIYQYQGKQNKKIDQKVYDDCENWFYEHNLLLYNKKLSREHPEWYKNHSKITKEYVVMSLKENKYINNYDDMNFIHNYFTNIPCPDISDIENELLDDFDSFLEVYESFSDLDRTNLLNGQYILYRFLKRRKRPVNINDFHMVSTRDRLSEYSEIYNRICMQLEWRID